MTLRLNASIAGYVEIDAPSSAASNTLVLPNGNGSDGNILGTDGSGNLSWVNGRMVQGTSQASTSGTAIDFTGIPSWVKRVTVMFQGVSTSGTSHVLVQIGAGSVTTTGYLSTSAYTQATTGTSTSTAGFIVHSDNAAFVRSGTVLLTQISGNAWVSSHTLKVSTSQLAHGGGDVTLSGTLDRVRITTVNGTDTFDAGSINILYEG